MDPKELSQKIAAILDNKKAHNVVTINIHELSVVADYFVVCAAHSSIHVRALADEVEEQLEQEGISMLRCDGYKESRWIVMDYGSVLVHIFHVQEREFYNIERLWSDAGNITHFSQSQ
jgi:ribosome-associated protein